MIEENQDRQDAASPSNSEKRIVSFDQWESGEMKLTDEIFDRVTIGPRCFFGSSDGSNAVIENAFYKGRETGTLLGEWFAEVMEPVS